MNGADWSKRYPLIIQDAARIKGSAILDAEVVWLGSDGVADFEALHSRSNDARATALAFDLLMLDEEDMRRKSYVERKAALRKLLRGDRGIQYVEHTEGHGDRLFSAVCTIGLEGIVSKKLDRALSIGAVESLDQSQKSKGARCNSRSRWNVLKAGCPQLSSFGRRHHTIAITVKQPTVAAPNTKANDRLLSTIFIPHYEAGTMPLRFKIRHRLLACSKRVRSEQRLRNIYRPIKRAAAVAALLRLFGGDPRDVWGIIPQTSIRNLTRTKHKPTKKDKLDIKRTLNAARN